MGGYPPTAPRTSVLDAIYAECAARAARYPRNLADIYDRYADLQKRAGDEPVFPKEQLPGWERANPKPPPTPPVPTLQEMQSYLEAQEPNRRAMISREDQAKAVRDEYAAAYANYTAGDAPVIPTPAQAVFGQNRMQNIAVGHTMTPDVGYSQTATNYYAPRSFEDRDGAVRVVPRRTNALSHEYQHNQQQRDALAAGGPAAAMTSTAVIQRAANKQLLTEHFNNMYLIRDFARNGGFNHIVDRMVPPGASREEKETALTQVIDLALRQHTPPEINYLLQQEQEATETGNATFGAPAETNTLYETPVSFAALNSVATNPRSSEYLTFSRDDNAGWLDRMTGSYDPRRDVNSDHYDPYYNDKLRGYWDEYLYGARGNQPDNPNNLYYHDKNTKEEIEALRQLEQRRAFERDALMQNYDRLVQWDPEFANTPMGRYLRFRQLYDADPANNYRFLADAAGIDEATAKSIYDRMQNAADSPLWGHKNRALDGIYTEEPTKFPLTPGYKERGEYARDTYSPINKTFRSATLNDARAALPAHGSP